jgi:hypothetical protein
MDNENNNTINNNINITNSSLTIDKSYTPSKPLVTNEIGEIENSNMDNESINALENNSPTESMDDDKNEDYQQPGDVEYERFEQYMDDLIDGDYTDMSDDAYEHRYNNFENYIESSDYTTNYGENEDGEYENY